MIGSCRSAAASLAKASRGTARAAAQCDPAASAPAASARMLAWRVHGYGPPSELRLEEARVPPLRAPDELLVRVHAASLNPIDIAMIGGYGSRILNTWRTLEGVEGAEGVEFPLVVGRDFAGEVVAAGPAARLRRGQRVWGVVPPHRSGSHAQYVVVKDQWAGVLPHGLSEQAAGGALYAALTACAALRAAGVPVGAKSGGARSPRVLLLGLGGVGHAALQLLVHGGVQVVVGCSGELAERARELGAALALDRHAPDYDTALQDSGPYDAIVDCAGLGGGEAGARRWRFARYVTLTTPLLRDTDARGLLAGSLSAVAELAAHCAAVARPTAVAAATEPACVPPHVRWAFFSPRAADIELLRRLADRGQFTVEVERAYAWREARDAYERAARGHARGKTLLDFTAP